MDYLAALFASPPAGPAGQAALVPHSRTRLSRRAEEAAVHVIRSGVVNDSHVREQFERAVSHYLGRRHAWATSTGTLALYLGLRLLEIGPGDEVIIPTYVCDDVLTAVLQAGGTPIPADFTPADFNLDPDDVRRKLSGRTRAIVVAHMFGMPAALDTLLAAGLPLVEDCAHALGATYRGRPAGTLGRLAVLSFHGLKMLTTGEGGMLLCDDEQLRERKRVFDVPDFGRGEYALHLHLSNVLAAIGLAQLSDYDDALCRRRAIALTYTERLSDLGGARLPLSMDDDRRSACFRYPLLLAEGLSYVEIERAFLAEGVVVRRPVKQLLHRALGLPPRQCPVASETFERIVSIPAFPDLTSNEIDRVVCAARKILQ